MSAIGPKQTSLVAPHMSAFGGKADMTVSEFRFCRCFGVKRPCRFAAHMSAFAKADISFITDTFCARRAQGHAADRLAKKISSGAANGVRISNLIGLLPPSVSGNWPRVGSERLGGRHVVLG